MFLGTLLYETGDYAASFHHLAQAAHYFRHTGDPRSLTMTLAHLHRTALQIGCAPETEGGLNEALQIARATGSPFGVMLVLEQKALQVATQGNLGIAQEYLDEALTRALQIGDRWSQSRVLTMRGDLALLLVAEILYQLNVF